MANLMNPQNPKTLHQILNEDDTRCLFCNEYCNVKLDSTTNNGFSSYNISTYDCASCFETFEVHWLGYSDPTEVLSFVFTCNGITVFIKYDSGMFIGKQELLFNKQVNVFDYTVIPFFDINFSLKDELFEKLSTYMVFS